MKWNMSLLETQRLSVMRWSLSSLQPPLLRCLHIVVSIMRRLTADRPPPAAHCTMLLYAALGTPHNR